MRKLLSVYLKGFSMGAADVVPGVSGATIALIVGIYDRMIAAITAIDPRRFRSALRVHEPEARATLRDEFESMDLPFLITLGLGVMTAIVVLSRLMHGAATTYPVPTYGFFFGLIAASAVVLYGQIEAWTPARVGVSLLAIVIAFVITGATAGDVSHGPLIVFVAGAIAICAMVLPGVSGAFFLLVLGQYEYLTGVLSEFVDGVIGLLNGAALEPVIEAGAVVGIFGAGAIIGLFTMAHAVGYALDRYRAATLAFLVSLMVGALRLPYVEVTTNLGETAYGTTSAAVVAGLVGAGAVLLVNWYTDDLEY
ncbi:DUF368 domain-containing protein [Natronolimnohabitans innermongolicus]|uniref:DUF368 domain-containing protein n=1 Tax=Natronolimnohabitans innermongolicus JCM 12255 TaxID=1227499 RepID=L9WR56_9EURY|nr:DUF368 domain-containing protein [Natronolimnohabitans innermongolicus]ELY51686.1 hypothetical protein C493_17191 [Natronolimnohabitans innermongolicus JCM 12255]